MRTLVKSTMEHSHSKLVDFYVDMAFSTSSLLEIVTSGLLTNGHVPFLTVSMPSSTGDVPAMAYGLNPGEVRAFGRTSERGHEVMVVFSCNDKAGNDHVIARWSNAYSFSIDDTVPPVSLPATGGTYEVARKMLKILQQHSEASHMFIHLAELQHPGATFSSNQPLAIVCLTYSCISCHCFSRTR